MEEIAVTHSLTHSLLVTASHFCCSVVIWCHRRERKFLFVCIYEIEQNKTNFLSHERYHITTERKKWLAGTKSEWVSVSLRDLRDSPESRKIPFVPIICRDGTFGIGTIEKKTNVPNFFHPYMKTCRIL